jgi:hypothetical protein
MEASHLRQIRDILLPKLLLPQVVAVHTMVPGLATHLFPHHPRPGLPLLMVLTQILLLLQHLQHLDVLLLVI